MLSEPDHQTGNNDGTEMEDGLNLITRTGASGTLVSEFLAVQEATAPDGGPKYAPVPVIAWLAKVVLGVAGGPNRDVPLFELCHLAHILNRCAPGDLQETRMLFFLSVERATPGHFRNQYEILASDDAAIQTTETGVEISYPDGRFTVQFGRMPFLAALYEFLSGLNGFQFYESFNNFLDRLVPEPDAEIGIRQIQDVTNELSRVLRRYRQDHIPRAKYEDKFERIYRFLKAREPSGRLVIDDSSVLEFWLNHASANEFKGYKTVFDAFVHFVRSFEEGQQQSGLTQAASIGKDRDASEVDLDEFEDFEDQTGIWETPLAVLESDPASRINYFKKESERKAIEQLMEYGPHAAKLPLAFLRLESFGPVQARITNDLQIGRGKESVRQRLTCRDAVPYAGLMQQFENILDHVKQLQKATYFALVSSGRQPGREDAQSPDGNVVSLFGGTQQHMVSLFNVACQSESNVELSEHEIEETELAAERAFKSLTRKGFDMSSLQDEDYSTGFQLGAGALLQIGTQLESYMKSLGRLAGGADWADRAFEADKKIFTQQFTKIYGDPV